MKLWKSYASNHSTGCTIIGKFNTEDAASKARNKIMQLVNLAIRLENIHPTKFIGTGLDARKQFGLEKAGALGAEIMEMTADWEEYFKPVRRGKVVTMNLYTAGYGINEIADIMKKHGGRVQIIGV